ncbi:MAG: succinate dehydrogenase assembly factor 2, partial [Pseudomonadota bacterium]
MTGETPEHRLKRLRLRSWRRGIKEMDLILGRFADAELAALSAEELDAYEALIAED